MRKLAKLVAVVVLGCSSMSGVNAMMIDMRLGELHCKLGELSKQVSVLNQQNQELWKCHIRVVEDNIAYCLKEQNGEPSVKFRNWLKSVEGGETSFSTNDLMVNVKPFLDQENQHNPVAFFDVYGGLFKQLSESVSTGIDISSEVFSKLKKLLDNINSRH